MGFKKYILSPLILLIYISLVSAADFDVEIIPISNKIAIDEFAKFELKIKNNLNRLEEYRIYNTNFPTWDVRTDPIVNPITLELQPDGEGSVELVVDPLKIKDVGTYAINLNIRSKIGDKLQSVPLKVSVISTEGLIGGYVPTVVTSVGMPEKIDPRKEIPIKIILNNQNIIEYPELVINLNSDLIKDTLTIKLGAKEEKTLDLTATIDPLTPPREDTLVVSVFRGNDSLINPIVRQTKASKNR